MRVGDIIEIAGVRSLITYIDEEGIAHAINDDGTVCCLWATKTENSENIEMELKYLLWKINKTNEKDSGFIN